MNILYSGDKNIKRGLLLSLLSLARNTAEPLNVYVLTADIEHGGRRWEAMPGAFAPYLTEELRAVNPRSSVEIIDVSELFRRELPERNMDTRFTPGCMVRLFADEVPVLPDKLLYLDYDVVARKDIGELYHTDISDYEMAGVLDYYGSWFFYRSWPRRDYVNSGVLLLNMDMIRRTALFARCRELMKTKWMFMPDQSALNALCDHKLLLPRRYNEQRRLHADTVLQHFSTSFRLLWYPHMVNVKPWQADKVHGVLGLREYDDLLAEYARKMLTINSLNIF